MLFLTLVCAASVLALNWLGARSLDIAKAGVNPFAPARVPLLAFMAATVWSAWRHARSNGFLELVACMPLPRQEIAENVSAALVRLFLPPLILISALQLIIASRNAAAPEILLLAGFLTVTAASGFFYFLLLPLVCLRFSDGKHEAAAFACALSVSISLDLFFGPFVMLQIVGIAAAISKLGPFSATRAVESAIRETRT